MKTHTHTHTHLVVKASATPLSLCPGGRNPQLQRLLGFVMNYEQQKEGTYYESMLMRVYKVSAERLDFEN